MQRMAYALVIHNSFDKGGLKNIIKKAHHSLMSDGLPVFT
ncbi:hypothetical protein B4077_3801 [Bacillus cereus]|uniref:Uncharacterized protein n=1 Tax=Bacillus cereus TaxID=1396 RepID=A0A0G8F270_BACCE|nr:hypothetical protein B4077_3801 [Bacillus cereus]